MLEREEVVLVIIGRCDESASLGRTALQKLSYLAAAQLGWDNLAHTAYYYGPYSRALDRTTNVLVERGLVEETAEDLDFIGASGFRGRRYTYRLTPQGKEALARVGSLAEADVADLEKAIDSLTATIGLDQARLSIAAKTHFLASKGAAALTTEEIRERGRELGWTLSAEAIDKVSEKLERLGLASVAGQ